MGGYDTGSDRGESVPDPGGRQLSAPVPPQLSALLQASDDVTRSRAWTAFLDEYSRLLIATTRKAAVNHDGAMDHYAYILDELRQDDFHRLRSFAGEGRGKFTTWLVVVARRLCVDHHRQTHGRTQPGPAPGHVESVDHIARQNLADLVAGEIDWERIEDNGSVQPDGGAQIREQRQALVAAVERLDIPDQLLLKLRFEDDIPIGMIGPVVGLSSRWQVHRRMKLVLARLRDELEAGGFTEP